MPGAEGIGGAGNWLMRRCFWGRAASEPADRGRTGTVCVV